MMQFALERLKKLTAVLGEYRVKHADTSIELQARRGKAPRTILEDSSAGWEIWNDHECWGEGDGHCWFRIRTVIPQELEGMRAVLKFSTSRAEGWDENRSQFLAFINGEPVEALDVNHREFILTDCAAAGTEYRVDLEGFYETFVPAPVEFHCEMLGIDTATEALWYDMDVLLQSVVLLDENSRERIELMKALETAAGYLDLRRPYTAEYYEGISHARKYLDAHAYNGEGNGVVAHGVGHTHIDVAWLWDLEQTREKVVRSFSSMLRLLERYPEFIFMSSQPQLYRFLKEDYPDVYERVKERIREGRWEAEGGMYLEADCNIPSGESLVRQFIHGKRFFREEFGVDSSILWLPDVFGYSAALPQIMKLCGIDSFMTTKISWSETNKMPMDSFYWEGIDGTRILTHFVTTTSDYDLNPNVTSYCGPLNPKHTLGSWTRYQQKELSNATLITYGFGDGGGGTTPQMLETARRLEKGIPGVPKFQFSTAREFFDKLRENLSGNSQKEGHTPTWVGELYLEFHRGTYTTMARNKRYNRQCEFLLLEAEQLLAAEKLLLGGQTMPEADLWRLWDTVLLNQFHDIIPGSSIQRVYEDSRAQYEAVLQEGGEILRVAKKRLACAAARQESVVVFNPHSFAYNELVETVLPESVALYDGGEKLPVQRLANGNTLLLASGIPPKGYKVFRAGKSVAASHQTNHMLMVSENSLENDFLSISFDGNMNICSLYDKEAARELVEPGHAYNRLIAFEDRPYDYDAWNVDCFYTEKSWDVNSVESIEILERGPLRACVRVSRHFMDSTIRQDFCLCAHSRVLDIRTEVDWKESHILLKAEFPNDLHITEARFEIQYGNLTRPTHRNTSWDEAKFEVCGQKWCDMSEHGYGVSLLNDCKYGYDVLGARMRLSLLRSPTWPNPEADRELHRFTYSIYPHLGDFRSAGTVPQAYLKNWGLTALYVPGEEAAGTSVPEYSAARLDCDTAAVEVVKTADQSGDTIVRVYEFGNRRSPCLLTLGNPYTEAWECDLLEQAGERLPMEDATHLRFTLKPYEIKTLRFAPISAE